MVWMLDWDRIQDHWDFWQTPGFGPVMNTISKLFVPGRPFVRYYDFGEPGMVENKWIRLFVWDEGWKGTTPEETGAKALATGDLCITVYKEIRSLEQAIPEKNAALRLLPRVRRQLVSTIFKPDGVICGTNATKRINTLLNVAIRFPRFSTSLYALYASIRYSRCAYSPKFIKLAMPTT
jgi:hypothetical protein